MNARIALALVLSATPIVALCQSAAFTVRLSVTRADFVGAAPRHTFTLVNRTVLAQSVATPLVSGAAAVVESSCTERLAPGQSCAVTVSLNVASLGAVTGAVRVPVGADAANEVLHLSAEGISAQSAPEVSSSQVDLNSADNAASASAAR